MVFNGEFLVSGNSAISLRAVESMGFELSDEDRTIDALKNDRVLKIRTLSGMEYSISVRAQVPRWALNSPDLNLDIWQMAIFDKWKHLLMGK